MVMHSASGNSVTANPTIEISHEGLRSILNQIEAQLLDSEVYRRTMAGLQTMLGEASDTAQILVKAVGREAVRLTFQQFVRQYNIVPVDTEGTNTTNLEKSDSRQTAADSAMHGEAPSNTAFAEELTYSLETTKPSGSRGKFGSEVKPPKKLTKAELEAQKAAQERDQILSRMGQELRLAREARSLSLFQLYSQTLVPMHHIEALETGRLAELPEDVYIRGFIRRLGHALGLNGTAMAASIPEPDPVKSVVPSWYRSTAPSLAGIQLNSLHLYLGYTALIAGSVGVWSWMSNQSAPKTTVEPEPATPSKASVSPKAEPTELTSKPGLKSSKAGVKAGTDIAPPEALPF